MGSSMQAPEPSELGGTVGADVLVQAIQRAMAGEDPDDVRADLTRPQTALPEPEMVMPQNLEKAPARFLSWLAVRKDNPEQTNELGRILVEMYEESPDTADYLWTMVKEGAQSGDEDIPKELVSMAKGENQSMNGTSRPLALPKV